MSRWPTKPLGDLAVDLQQGFASRPDGDSMGVPHLRPLNLTEEGTLVDVGTKRVPCAASQLTRYDLRVGDILFNNTNSPNLVGKVAIFKLEGVFVFSNHLTRIRVDSNQVLPEFLQRFLFLLWRNGFFKQQCTQWINQAAFNLEALSSLPVPIPTLIEQERIVRILDEAEILRQLRTTVDERTKHLKKSLLEEMFGDPLASESKWPVRSLGELCGSGGIKAGPFGSSLKKDCYTESGPRVYGQEQVIAGDFEVGDYHIRLLNELSG